MSPRSIWQTLIKSWKLSEAARSLKMVARSFCQFQVAFKRHLARLIDSGKLSEAFGSFKMVARGLWHF